MAIQKLLLPVLLSIAAVVAAFIARGTALRLLRKWDRRAATRVGELVRDSIKIPSIYWCLAVGIYLGTLFSDMPQKYSDYLLKSIHVLVILSFTVASATLASKILRNYIQKSELQLPATGLAYGILKGTIYIIGLIIILGVLGISVAPLITALGVGGLAVALALQDTLANLFAGIHILVEKSIRVGDFVKLESGQEGKVEDITWRTTRIQMAPNNMVVIPNKKLSESVVVNYSLPGQVMALAIKIGVSYSSDPDHIERVLSGEAAKAIGQVPGLLPTPEPFVRFIPGFGENSIDFTLICQVAEFADQFLVQHELRKRIFRRFKDEGIEIPLPQRTISIKQEKL